MKNKSKLRIAAKSIRNSLNIPEISTIIATRILKLPLYQNAKHVMIFYPLKNEINLLKLLQDSKKTFYLPRICGDCIECCPYKSGDELALSSAKIYEPCVNAIDKSKIELIFVPALAADYEFNRLGYGGGFYDRFLGDMNAVKLIPVPEELLFEKLPVESHDIPCDGIVTQGYRSKLFK